ncbi:Early endosome antigen 1 [Nymphon striatum]|nr:Early endosome antigen 1 [Nymphon striatum]
MPDQEMIQSLAYMDTQRLLFTNANMISAEMARHNIPVHQAKDDSDTLIVKVAIDLAKRVHTPVVVVAQDTDIMSAESADAKSKLDEETGNKAALEHHIHQLQVCKLELYTEPVGIKTIHYSTRPSEDDVAVLKQELISVQMLMDQMAQQGEEEKKNLGAELLNFQTKYNKVDNERKSLQQQLETAPRPEDIETFKDIINQGSSSSEKLKVGLQEKEKVISELKLKLQKAEYDSSENQQTNDQLLEANEKYVKLAETRLHDCEKLELELNKKQSKVQELKDFISEKESHRVKLIELNERMEMDLKESRDSTQVLLVEKEHSYNHLKIEFDRVQGLFKNKESELSDLNVELQNIKKHYQEISVLNEEYKNYIREEEIRSEQEQEKEKKIFETSDGEHDDKEEKITKLECEVNKLNAKIKSDQMSYSDSKIKFENEIKEFQNKMETQQNKVVALDDEVKSKAEQLFVAEAQRSSLKVDLENQLTGTKNILNDKTQECDKLREKLDHAQAEILMKTEETGSLKCEINDVKYKLKHEENKNGSLESNLTEVKENQQVVTLLSEEAKRNLELQLKQQTDLKVNLSNQIRVLTGEIDSAKTEAVVLQTSLSEKVGLHQKEKDVLIEAKNSSEHKFQAEKTGLKSKISSTESELSNCQVFNLVDSAVSSLTAKINTQEFELKEKQKELDDLTESKLKISADYDKLHSRNDELNTQLQESEVKLHTEQNENKSLNNELEAFRSDHENVVNELEKEKLLCSEAKECSLKLENDLKVFNDHLTEKNENEEQLNCAIQDLTEVSRVKVQMSASILKLDEELKTAKQTLQEITKLKNQFEKEVTEKKNSLTELQDSHSSILSALSDLTEKFENYKKETVEGEKKKLFSKVLDMIFLIAENARFLGQMLNEVVKEGNKWSIEINKGKTKVMMVTNNKQQEDINIKLNGVGIQQVDKFQYLGEIINLKDAKELLLNQKVQFQGTIEKLEEKLSQVSEKHERDQGNWSNERSSMLSELEEIRSKLEEEINAHKNVLQVKEENETKYEMQLEALTENLGVLRQDFVSEQEKNEEVEKRVDELTGEKLATVKASKLKIKFKNDYQQMVRDTWSKKPMHGKFPKYLRSDHIDIEQSFQWMRHVGLK